MNRLASFCAGVAIASGIIGATEFLRAPKDFPAATARSAIAVNKGDTLVPSFAILTDSVTGLANTYNVRIRNCGRSQFIVRMTDKRTATVRATLRLDLVACPDTVQVQAINAPDTTKSTPCGFSSDTTIHPCAVDSSLSPALKTGAPCAWTIVRDTTIACLSIPKPPAEAPPLSPPLAKAGM